MARVRHFLGSSPNGEVDWRAVSHYSGGTFVHLAISPRFLGGSYSRAVVGAIMASQARGQFRGRDCYVGARCLSVHVTFLPGRICDWGRGIVDS
jgi:hypothetical protein